MFYEAKQLTIKMRRKEPRILIVNGQSIYDNNATGITLRSIVSRFDVKNVKEVYYSNEKGSQHDKEIESFKLDSSTVPLNCFVRRIIGRRGIDNYNKSIKNLDVRSKEGAKNIKVLIKSFLLGFINASPIKIKDKDIIRIIDDFSPEIVYTLGADIIPLRLASFFSKRYDIPIMIHYMDNWPETKYTLHFILRPFRGLLIRLLNVIQKENPIALVISEKMATAYNKRFAPVLHFAIMNSIDIISDSSITNIGNNHNDKVILAYLGGLHLNRYKQLVQVEKAIINHNKRNHSNEVRLLIYTSEEDKNKYEDEFDLNYVEFKDYVPHERVFNEYQKADILVHIESFDHKLIDYTKYSLSTKISEYMFAGKPILLYAPKELAVYQYVSESNCGICVETFDELQNAIEEMAINDKRRLMLGSEGRKKAMKNHTTEAAYQILLNACNELIDVKAGNRNV